MKFLGARILLSGVESVVALEESYVQSNPNMFGADVLWDAASLTSLNSFRIQIWAHSVCRTQRSTTGSMVRRIHEPLAWTPDAVPLLV